MFEPTPSALALVSRPRVLITGGPTVEDIDPVRFITNRSTGRMGLAVAEAVLRAGGTPLLILGPTHLAVPPEIALARVRSAADMNQAVRVNLGWADSLVMTAAVADYTPVAPLDSKMKKKDGELFLRLRRTVDILAGIKDLPERQGKFVVGFSLDTRVNLDEGRRKLKAKNLDLVVVNGVDSFGSDRSAAWLVALDSETDCGVMGKDTLAEMILLRMLAWLTDKSSELGLEK
ncbi:MAG: phosphopantothenoylcysteine decarboxylase [Planctomycetes bacterium]|nr:phosphopantothenoylcysteine decarboxylase [Planctomycetota bacterium]